jgi:quinol monooxygenase YgiN
MKDNEAVKIFLSGHIDVPDDRLEAVKSALPQHISLTRAEAGCISFDVVQNDTISGRFMVSEVFVDQAAFDAHQVRTKNSDWFKTTEGIPREYSITVGSQ